MGLQSVKLLRKTFEIQKAKQEFEIHKKIFFFKLLMKNTKKPLEKNHGKVE